jgi:hypothetical protein
MSEHDRLESEKLVAVCRAGSEWEGNLLVGLLRDNGIEATLQLPPSIPPLDAAERLLAADKMLSVLVLEHERDRARDLIAEFQSAVTDERLLEAAAAQPPPLDREKIAGLRAALREQRRTFAFLGWMVAAFLAAFALLWAAWPAWLKSPETFGMMRWVTVAVLVVAAIVVGRLTGRAAR